MNPLEDCAIPSTIAREMLHLLPPFYSLPNLKPFGTTTSLYAAVVAKRAADGLGMTYLFDGDKLYSRPSPVRAIIELCPVSNIFVAVDAYQLTSAMMFVGLINKKGTSICNSVCIPCTTELNGDSLTVTPDYKEVCIKTDHTTDVTVLIEVVLEINEVLVRACFMVVPLEISNAKGFKLEYATYPINLNGGQLNEPISLAQKENVAGKAAKKKADAKGLAIKIAKPHNDILTLPWNIVVPYKLVGLLNDYAYAIAVTSNPVTVLVPQQLPSIGLIERAIYQYSQPLCTGHFKALDYNANTIFELAELWKKEGSHQRDFKRVAALNSFCLHNISLFQVTGRMGTMSEMYEPFDSTILEAHFERY